MSRIIYYHFIIDNKRRCALFFQSRRTSRLHIGVTSMDMPRERAAILRQRDASEHYIFRSLLQHRLTPATFLSASNGVLFSERQSEVRHAPLSAPERRPPPILHVTYLFSRLHPEGGRVTRSPPHGRLIIKNCEQ